MTSVPPSDSKPAGVRIRRLIQRKMEESWQTVPHFFVTASIDMTDVIRFRKDLGVTINDFILAAAVATLRLFHQIFGVAFQIETDPTDGSLLLACRGVGFRNLSHRVT